MNKSVIIGGVIIVVVVLALLAGAGWGTGSCGVRASNNAKTLTIEWQRFVAQSGDTCERCGLTQEEVQKASQILKQSFAPLGIQVALQEKSLDAATFAQDVSQSNRIWLGGRPLEEWLGAEVGKSACATCPVEAGCADDVECRTIKLADQTYETIPADLIIRAGLLAAFDLLSAGPTEPSPNNTSPASAPSCGSLGLSGPSCTATLSTETSCGGSGSKPAGTPQGCH